MKKILTLMILSIFLAACGGYTASNSTNSANSNANPAAYSNSGANTATAAKTSDSSPVMLDYNKLSNSSIDELNKFKGRTVTSKGKLDEWTTSKLKVGIGGTTAFCEGDFLEYKEAIDLFAKNKKQVSVSFRGTLDEATDLSGFTDLKMSDCVITDMEK